MNHDIARLLAAMSIDARKHILRVYVPSLNV